MDYDVLILGGGIIGCAAAYELSKYSLNIALIERDYDIADDIALVNTEIVYDGLQCSDDTMAKFQIEGNKLFDELSFKFDVPFKRCGSFIIAKDDRDVKRIERLHNIALKRGIDAVMLDEKTTDDIAHKLNIRIKKLLYSKNVGIVSPYDLAISYGEVACDNGVNFKLEEEVVDIQKTSKGFKVITNKNKFTCKMVINTTKRANYNVEGNLYKKSFQDKKYLNYLVLDNNFKSDFHGLLSNLSYGGENLCVISTSRGNLMIVFNTREKLDFDRAARKVKNVFADFDEKYVDAFYQSIFYDDNMFVDKSMVDEGYLRVVGKHYTEVTMAPFISKVLCDIVLSRLKCLLKKNFNDKRREFYRFRDMTNEKRNEIIKLNKSYGKVICPCHMVTEGEIIDSIRRPLGARTLEGIKRRVGINFGSCYGSYCFEKIVSILARETNKKLTDIVKDSKNSKLILGRIKEFDSM